jgi:uncharacterized membrane protein
MTYFRQLIDTNNTASSKVFTGLIFAAVTIIILFIKVLWLQQTPMEVLYFSAGIMMTFFGLSTFEQIKQVKYNINK